MNQASREALELVAEKAARLAQEEYVQWLQTNRGTLVQIGPDREGKLTIRHTRPTDTQRRALILTFRFFIQKSEHSSFRWLADNVMDDLEVSDDWKQQFIKIRDEADNWTDSPAGLRDGEHELTRGEILDVFIYGDAAHAKPAKKATFDRWLNYPTWFAIAEFEFDHVVIRTFQAIERLARNCEQELAR